MERRRLIAELDREPWDPFVTMRLTAARQRELAAYIALLPWQDYRVLTLYYSFGLSPGRIARETGHAMARGRIAYCKDRLTQCLALPRPIAEHHWRTACNLALNRRILLSLPAHTGLSAR